MQLQRLTRQLSTTGPAAISQREHIGELRVLARLLVSLEHTLVLI